MGVILALEGNANPAKEGSPQSEKEVFNGPPTLPHEASMAWHRLGIYHRTCP